MHKNIFKIFLTIHKKCDIIFIWMEKVEKIECSYNKTTCNLKRHEREVDMKYYVIAHYVI